MEDMEQIQESIYNLLTKGELTENSILKKENIKVWSTNFMRIQDVVRGINHMKSIGGNVIVYNNIVPNKKDIQNQYRNEIRIIDGNDLEKILIRNIHNLSDDEISMIEKELRLNR